MTRKLIAREKYLEDALRFRDTDLVKVMVVRQLDRSFKINGVEILAASDFFLA